MRPFKTLLLMLGLLSACNGGGAIDQNANTVLRNDLVIQPVGGVASGGTPGSHLHSEGRVSWSSLTPEDQARVKALLSSPPPKTGNFYYRITLEGPQGSQIIEALPETVPQALIGSIQSTLD
jgi:hypothetical protein